MAEKFAEWAMANTLAAIGLFLAMGSALMALGLAARNVALARREWRRVNGTNGQAPKPARVSQDSSDPFRFVTLGELRDAIKGVRDEIRDVMRELTESRERLAVKVEALPGEVRKELTAVLEGWLADSERRSAEMREQLAGVLASHGIIERRKNPVPVEVERRAKGLPPDIEG